jgi:uncharacterized membrane protein YfhO
VVSGPDSKDHYHAVAHPGKFDGVLPILWRESGESIYHVPLRSASLAHVIPKSAMVTRQPVNGLDVGQLRTYVDALDSTAIPPATINWKNPDHARIEARMDPSEVISVQITYDAGWRASIANRTVPTYADQLGFLAVDPGCSGDCTVELAFTGGTERRAALWVTGFVTAVLLAMLIWPLRSSFTFS